MDRRRAPHAAHRGRARRVRGGDRRVGGSLPAPGRAARRAAAGEVSARGSRVPAGRRRESVQRLGVEVLDPRRGRRPARRPHGGGQGQRVRGRHPDAQRLADHGGLRAARGRDRRHAAARRRRAHRRQDRGAGVLLRRRRDHRLSRPAAGEPAQPGVPVRFLLQRQRGRRRHGRGGHGARRRPGRLDPAAVVLERLLRAQADLGPRAVHGHLPDRADDRPRRTDGTHGRRLRGDAGRDRGRGRSRPSPGRRVCPGLHGGAGGWRRRPARGRAERGLRHPGRFRARRRRRRARPPTRWRERAPRSRRSRSRCTATGSRSGTRSPSRARPT